MVKNEKTEPHKELTGSGTSVLREGMKFVHISDTRDIILEDGRPLYCTREDAPTDPGSSVNGNYKHFYTLQNTVKMFRLAEGGGDLEEFTEMVRQSVRENSSLKDDADHLFELLGNVKRIKEPKNKALVYLLLEDYKSDNQTNLEKTLAFTFEEAADREFSQAVIPFLLYNGYNGWTRDARENYFLTEYLFITPLSDLRPTAVKRLNRDGTEEEDISYLATIRAKENYEKLERRKRDDEPPPPKKPIFIPIDPASLPKVQITDHKEKVGRERYEQVHQKMDARWLEVLANRVRERRKEEEMERWRDAMAKKYQEKREKAEMERRPKKIGGRGYFVNA